MCGGDDGIGQIAPAPVKSWHWHWHWHAGLALTWKERVEKACRAAKIPIVCRKQPRTAERESQRPAQHIERKRRAMRRFLNTFGKNLEEVVVEKGRSADLASRSVFCRGGKKRKSTMTKQRN